VIFGVCVACCPATRKGPLSSCSTRRPFTTGKNRERESKRPRPPLKSVRCWCCWNLLIHPPPPTNTPLNLPGPLPHSKTLFLHTLPSPSSSSSSFHQVYNALSSCRRFVAAQSIITNSIPLSNNSRLIFSALARLLCVCYSSLLFYYNNSETHTSSYAVRVGFCPPLRRVEFSCWSRRLLDTSTVSIQYHSTWSEQAL